MPTSIDEEEAARMPMVELPAAKPARPPFLSRITFSVAMHSAAVGLIVAAAYLSVGPAPPQVHDLFPYTLREPVTAPAGRPAGTTRAAADAVPGSHEARSCPAPPDAGLQDRAPEPAPSAKPAAELDTEEILPPARLATVEPVYPAPALRARAEGEVILDVIVTRQGRIAGIHVVGSNPIFDDAAVEAVRQWRFAPALHDGRPVDVSMRVVVEFKLA